MTEYNQTTSAPKEEPTRLTERELEILCLIAQGHSSKDTASLLFVSRRTVDFHLANIYEKLLVTNRVQAILVAGRLGLIRGEPVFGIFRKFQTAVEQHANIKRSSVPSDS